MKTLNIAIANKLKELSLAKLKKDYYISSNQERHYYIYYFSKFQDAEFKEGKFSIDNRYGTVYFLISLVVYLITAVLIEYIPNNNMLNLLIDIGKKVGPSNDFAQKKHYAIYCAVFIESIIIFMIFLFFFRKNLIFLRKFISAKHFILFYQIRAVKLRPSGRRYKAQTA